MPEPVEIDGSFGEGGGQILRTSLAISLVTGKPLHIKNIRAGRKKPGLMRQHLTAVNAAAEIGAAEVKGNVVGSSEIYFQPTTIKPGEYHFKVGTAGSTTLVVQTVLPALTRADGQSHLIIEGGSHNPFAPPFDFLAKVFLPILSRMGPRVTASLERPGFYPAGGGRIHLTVEPGERLLQIEIIARGRVKGLRSTAIVARLPRAIGERELNIVRQKLGLKPECLTVQEVANSPGPGNVLTVEVEAENITELFTAFGERGVPAEKVAEQAVSQTQEYISADVPVGRYLADQLLLPMALAAGGRFRTLSPSRHTTTNIEVIKRFLDVDIKISRLQGKTYEIEIQSL